MLNCIVGFAILSKIDVMEGKTIITNRIMSEKYTTFTLRMTRQ